MVAGLMLNIKPSGAKSWVLRTMVGTKRKDIGLGGYPEVTLAMATQKARSAKEGIKDGIDPVVARKAKQTNITWTFKTCALTYIEAFKPSWKNVKHGQQWENTLETYVYPHFGDKHVKDVDTEDVMKAIRPLWSTKNETMVRVRNRIELVLSWAAAQGYRPRGLNPAQWRGHLDQVLPKPSKVNKREHHPAVQVKDAFAFMQALKEKEGIGARCLEFVMLTGGRSGNAYGATWSEIDMTEKIWRIAQVDMKANRVHRVPLSDSAIALLKSLPRFEGTDYVFPGRDIGKPLSDMTMGMLMRRMGFRDADGRFAVPHGLRSTVTDWAADCTNYPSEVRDMVLAHSIGDETEAAYRRGDLFKKRRDLMSDWASFINTAPAIDADVVPMPTIA